LVKNKNEEFNIQTAQHSTSSVRISFLQNMYFDIMPVTVAYVK